MLAISEEGRFLREDFEKLTQKGKYFELVLATTGIPEQPENAPKGAAKNKLSFSGEPSCRQTRREEGA
jgi:hypothetical protein